MHLVELAIHVGRRDSVLGVDKERSIEAQTNDRRLQKIYKYILKVYTASKDFKKTSKLSVDVYYTRESVN